MGDTARPPRADGGLAMGLPPGDRGEQADRTYPRGPQQSGRIGEAGIPAMPQTGGAAWPGQGPPLATGIRSATGLPRYRPLEARRVAGRSSIHAIDGWRLRHRLRRSNSVEGDIAVVVARAGDVKPDP